MIISPYCYVCFESQAHDSSLSRVPIVSATVPQRQCWLSNKMNENGEPGGVCRYRMDLISLSSWLVIQLVITESMELNVIRRLSLYFQSTTHNSIVQSNQTLNPVLVLPVTFFFWPLWHSGAQTVRHLWMTSKRRAKKNKHATSVCKSRDNFCSCRLRVIFKEAVPQLVFSTINTIFIDGTH